MFRVHLYDEEIGLRGVKAMDLARFPVDFAYTIDSCEVGEFIFETFNAGQVRIDIQGMTAHPMSAKGVMVNPLLVATDLISRFDPLDTPKHTAGREGYCWFSGMTSNAAAATLKMSLRDFDDAGPARRKEMVLAAVQATQAAFPGARINCAIEDAYRNIDSSLGNDRRSLELLERDFVDLGIEPKIFPLRGGTTADATGQRSRRVEFRPLSSRSRGRWHPPPRRLCRRRGRDFLCSSIVAPTLPANCPIPTSG
jgi:tripeptide aminopeptidase